MGARRTVILGILLLAAALTPVTAGAQVVIPEASKGSSVQEAAKTPENRASYAAQMRRQMLSAGVDVSFTSLDARPPNSKKMNSALERYPKLIVWGWFDDPAIFAFISRTELLKSSKYLGFSILDFWDRGNRGHWVYDLSGPDLPTCDVSKRVCL